MMNLRNMLRFGALAGAVFAVTYLPSTAQAQCGADPEGNPIGVVSRPDARGPSLTGVGAIEFLNSDGYEARGARIVVRLRRTGQPEAFFALIPEYGCSGDNLSSCNPSEYVCDWDPFVDCSNPPEYACDWDNSVACDPSEDPDPCLDDEHPCGSCEEITPCVDDEHPDGLCEENTQCIDLQNPEGTCEANLFNYETPEETQEKIFAALREPVLGAFFEDRCGSDGKGCPEVQLVFKKLEEFALTDDGVSSQFVIADIVVATTEPL